MGETFVIVNPGQGVNSTFNGFWNFLYGTPPDCTNNTCPAAQKVIPAARSYDGLEFRLMKSVSPQLDGHVLLHLQQFPWQLRRPDQLRHSAMVAAAAMLRTTAAPLTSRTSRGTPMADLRAACWPPIVPTPQGLRLLRSALAQSFATDFGVFQSAYSGTPLSSELDVGYSYAGQPAFPVDIVNRGKWIDVTQNPTTGVITTSAPYVKRTPWYTDTDFNFKQAVKLGEAKSLSFDATFSNVLNQHQWFRFGRISTPTTPEATSSRPEGNPSATASISIRRP